MNPLLLSFIKENFGSIFVAVVLCSVAGAYWLEAWRTSVNLKLNDLEPARAGFTSLSEKVDHVVLRVDEIWQLLIKGVVLKSSSPLSLSEVGEEISKNTNAKALAKKHIEKLKKEDVGDGKLNAFEIQNV